MQNRTTKIAVQNCSSKLQGKIAVQNCSTKSQPKITAQTRSAKSQSRIAVKNRRAKSQRKIAAKNRSTKMQCKIARENATYCSIFRRKIRDDQSRNLRYSLCPQGLDGSPCQLSRSPAVKRCKILRP